MTPSQPVHLTFAKHVDRNRRLVGLRLGRHHRSAHDEAAEPAGSSGPIWFVTFDWIIDAGPSSFTARLSGILNTSTGGVVMTGRVISGYRLGAMVIEQGQLADPATSSFAGTIDVMPKGR